MLLRNLMPIVVVCVILVMILGCGDTDDCVCVFSKTDPPIDYLDAIWIDGEIFVQYPPFEVPDAIFCSSEFKFANRHPGKPFRYVHIEKTEVFLAARDSILGDIDLSTGWWGYMGPNSEAEAYFWKPPGNQQPFVPPCSEKVVLRFTVSNTEGDTKVIYSDTLLFGCNSPPERSIVSRVKELDRSQETPTNRGIW
jgi:hypothetical protein